MRFKGCNHGIKTHVLLDGGGSDNFIQSRLAHFLKLLIKPTLDCLVLVGNGHALKGEG